MLNFNSILIGSHDAEALAAFYEKFLGKPQMEDGGYYGWQVSSAFFSIGPHSEIKGKAKEPQRIIINFETKEVKKEFERIKKTGAKVVKNPYSIENSGTDFLIATFADPDGNYFQLMSPWEGDKSVN